MTKNGNRIELLLILLAKLIWSVSFLFLTCTNPLLGIHGQPDPYVSNGPSSMIKKKEDQEPDINEISEHHQSLLTFKDANSFRPFSTESMLSMFPSPAISLESRTSALLFLGLAIAAHFYWNKLIIDSTVHCNKKKKELIMQASSNDPIIYLGSMSLPLLSVRQKQQLQEEEGPMRTSVHVSFQKYPRVSLYRRKTIKTHSCGITWITINIIIFFSQINTTKDKIFISSF